MGKNKIPTKHIDTKNCTIYVCDVVKIENEIYIVKCDGNLHPFNPKNNDGKPIWSTSKSIEKIGTIEEYPEYFRATCKLQ